MRSTIMRIVIARRHRGAGGLASRLGFAAVMASGLAVLYLGFLLLTLGSRFAAISRDIPTVESVQALFYRQGEPTLPATRFYDRNGAVVLGELTHPKTASRRWTSVDPDAEHALPQALLDAVVAYHDPSYWEAGVGLAANRIRQAAALVLGERALPSRYGVSEQLAALALRSKGVSAANPVDHFIQASVLAEDISERIPKGLVMEWYLNSAYFGNLAYGIDAASLLYFDKHATDLTAAEGAMLAPVLSMPDQNPIDSPEESKLRQVEVLLAMVRVGSITQAQSQRALQEELDLSSAEEVRGGLMMGQPNSYLSARLGEILGSEYLKQGGYRVKTSLDADLQDKAECTTRFFLQRASDHEVDEGDFVGDDECDPIGFLPALRPGDIDRELTLSAAEAIVLDAPAGQILALVDQGEPKASVGMAGSGETLAHESGNMMLPFIYLTAFSRGYSPASMVLDIPEKGSLPAAAETGAIHGPVTMRTALSNSYAWAAANTLDLTGANHVLHTFRELGLEGRLGEDSLTEPEILGGDSEIGLVDLAFAHSTFANLGRMTGWLGPSGSRTDQVQALEPIIILQVLDPSGEEIFSIQPTQRSVVSPQLAYLVTDVLADPETRVMGTQGDGGIDLDRPAALFTSSDLESTGNWAVGFTPTRIVAAWLERDDREDFSAASQALRASGLWEALISYSGETGRSQGWAKPEGIAELEVCVPSGLLPTEYCPEVRTELFIQGREPTAFDNLYRPFLVNMETGNLATVFTPIELVEEHVYMIPPPEALEWAESAGIERPPHQYDGYHERAGADLEVEITSPSPFSYQRGWLRVRGDVRVDRLDYYRLQFGPGLNPTRWIQIGEDRRAPMIGGELGLWDTSGLEGLYTLQLVAVLDDGRVRMDAVPITIDSLPPSIRLISPDPGQRFSLRGDGEIVIQAEVTDRTGLSRVEFYVDGRRIQVREVEPYSVRWRIVAEGERVIFVRALDVAGNMAESERLRVQIGR